MKSPAGPVATEGEESGTENQLGEQARGRVTKGLTVLEEPLDFRGQDERLGVLAVDLVDEVLEKVSTRHRRRFLLWDVVSRRSGARHVEKVENAPAPLGKLCSTSSRPERPRARVGVRGK